MAYVLARFIVHYGAISVPASSSAFSSGWASLPPSTFVGALRKETDPSLAINHGYLLIALIVMGAILVAWHAAPTVAPAPA